MRFFYLMMAFLNVVAAWVAFGMQLAADDFTYSIFVLIHSAFAMFWVHCSERYAND